MGKSQSKCPERDLEANYLELVDIDPDKGPNVGESKSKPCLSETDSIDFLREKIHGPDCSDEERLHYARILIDKLNYDENSDVPYLVACEELGVNHFKEFLDSFVDSYDPDRDDRWTSDEEEAGEVALEPQNVVKEVPPYAPTLQDYMEANFSSVPRCLMTMQRTGAHHIDPFEPTTRAAEDFWTELHERRVGILVMFGDLDGSVTRHLVDCDTYIPSDDKETLKCGRLIVKRLGGPIDFHNTRCYFLGVRCGLVDESKGMYHVWLCVRSIQYVDLGHVERLRVEDEFDLLKRALLEEVPSQVVLVHGPDSDEVIDSPLKAKMLYEQKRGLPCIIPVQQD